MRNTACKQIDFRTYHIYPLVKSFKRKAVTMLYLFNTLFEPLSHSVIVLLFFLLWSLMSKRWGCGSKVPWRLHNILGDVWVDIPVISKTNSGEKCSNKTMNLNYSWRFSFFARMLTCRGGTKEKELIFFSSNEKQVRCRFYSETSSLIKMRHNDLLSLFILHSRNSTSFSRLLQLFEFLVVLSLLSLVLLAVLSLRRFGEFRDSGGGHIQLKRHLSVGLLKLNPGKIKYRAYCPVCSVLILQSKK